MKKRAKLFFTVASFAVIVLVIIIKIGIAN